MAVTTWCFVVLSCLVCLGQSAPPNRRRPNSSKGPETCVDMTRTLLQGMLHFPGLQDFLLNITTKDVVDVKLQMDAITTATHMGTHMDAPRHFNENGITIDEIPIQNFANVPAVVVDVRNKTNADPSYQIAVSDLEAWESAHGSIPNGSLVLFRTGWGERWSDVKKFLGTDQNDPLLLKFPGLGALAATWLAQRPIVGVGTECLSLDANGGNTKAAHRTILNSPHKMYILENLANLDQLPEKGARIQAFPMKIGGASGAPARVIGCYRSKPSARSSGSSGRRRRPQ